MYKFAAFAVLLLAVGAQAGCHNCPTSDKPQHKGSSIYNCINKVANLTLLKRAVDAAGLKPLLTDSDLEVTFFAPDNQAILDFLDDVEEAKGWDAAAVLKQKDLLANILKYHVVTKEPPFLTSFWPKYNPDKLAYKLVHTALPKNDKDFFKLKLYADADGDLQVEGKASDAELNCPAKTNWLCGKSIMHSIDEVMLPAELED